MSNTYRPTQGTLAYRVSLAVITGNEPLAEATIAASEKKTTAFVASVLADAVMHGWLTRRRDEARGIVYGPGPKLSHASLDGVEPDPIASPPVAQPVASLQPGPVVPDPDANPTRKKPGVPRGSPRSVLPEVDLSAIRITLAPKVQHHAKKKPGETKWGPLFEKLAAISIVGDKLPTVEMPSMFGKALQAAARSYSISTGGAVKFRVLLGKTKCTVQRIA